MAKTYDTYKDSGIAWIGNIPSEWKTCRIKDTSLLYTGNSIKDEEKDSFQDMNEARPYIATKDIDATYMSANYNNGLYIKHTDCNFRIAPPSSTLMCIEGGSAGRKKAFIDQEVSFVNKLCCFAPFEGVYGKYIYYFLCSPNFEDIFNSKITGLIGGVNIPTLKNIECLLPSISEQKAIATYLDEKCGEIDSLISLLEEMISELQAYKQSVITEAVTKGLDPNVPMKDSGAEWIGMIPEGWNICKLKFLCSSIKDGSHFSPTTTEEGFPYITAADVHGKGLDYANAKKISEKDYNDLVQSGCKAEKDDILLVKDGATTGRVGMKIENNPCVLLSSVAMLRVNTKSYPTYLMYMVSSDLLQQQISIAMAGSAMPRITLTKLNTFIALEVPLSEQQAIASYLDEKTSQIDSLIALKQEKITELKDYKKSIIYEYVTGKKKV